MAGEYLRAYLPSVMPAATGLGRALQDIEQNRIMRERIEQDRREMEERKATAEALRRSTWENKKYEQEWENEQQQRGFRQQDVHDVRQINAEKAKALAERRNEVEKALETATQASNSAGAAALTQRAAEAGIKINPVTNLPETQRIEEEAPPPPGAIDQLLGQPKGLDPMELLTGRPSRKPIDMAPREAASAAAAARSDAGVAGAERKMMEHELAAGPALSIDYGQGPAGIFDPVKVAQTRRNRAKATLGEMAPSPGAHHTEQTAFEAAKTAGLALAPVLDDKEMVKDAMAAGNQAAQRENARINAQQKSIQFNTGEGRRERIEERGDIRAFDNAWRMSGPSGATEKRRELARALDLMNDKNGIESGAVRNMILRMYEKGVATEQDFQRAVGGKAGTWGRIESWFEGGMSGDIGESEKNVIKTALRNMGRQATDRLVKARTEFLGLKKLAAPDVQHLYDKYDKIWFGNMAGKGSAAPSEGKGTGVSVSASGEAVEDIPSLDEIRAMAAEGEDASE